MPDADAHAKGDHPPLPDVLPESSRRAASGKPLLADGSYYVAYTWREVAAYEGTLRVESRSGRLFASGDFYRFEAGERDEHAQIIGLVPPRSPGLPIFPIADYCYYLRVTQIEPAETGFILTFEAHRFIPKVIQDLEGVLTSHWVIEGLFTARMMRAAAPPGYPSPEMFFVGEVSKEDGTRIGQMQMGRVSSALRKATIEIDRVPDSELPLHNGAGVTWKSVFDGIGWDLTVAESDSDVQKPDGPLWTPTDARVALRERRDSCDLDAEWRYHLLVVPLMAFAGSNFGFMYDHDEMPREGLFMSSHFVFSVDDLKWGPLRGERTGMTVTFFRTAVHEMGHAMGLDHNDSSFCFMRPTESIAKDAPVDMPFPTNIIWSFEPADEHQLRHWPDIVVRPGGIDIGTGNPLTAA